MFRLLFSFVPANIFSTKIIYITFVIVCSLTDGGYCDSHSLSATVSKGPTLPQRHAIIAMSSIRVASRK
tara:strand:- start:241 stop:447 length:207 start_codon:yes stop_codon:yes gene_type:complete